MNRVIDTEEELDALPLLSAVIDASGNLCRLLNGGWFGIIAEPNDEPWLMSGAECVELPATVIWEPVGISIPENMSF